MPALSIVEHPTRVELNIDSHPANLSATRHAIEALGQRCGFDEQSIHDLGLCLNEALANVIRHAYQGATDRPILVTAECANAEMRISIRDWGTGINPLSLPQKPRDPLCPGGLGLICLREMMDQVTCTPQPDGMLLTMSRTRRPTRAAI